MQDAIDGDVVKRALDELKAGKYDKEVPTTLAYSHVTFLAL